MTNEFGTNVTDRRIQVTPSAYTYPLLIKHLLHTPLAHAPEQEIVYRGQTRYSYRTLRDRIGRLASALAAVGVRRGDTVAMMDWDSHRYLECYFGVPMMGAVLQTVNHSPHEDVRGQRPHPRLCGAEESAAGKGNRQDQRWQDRQEAAAPAVCRSVEVSKPVLINSRKPTRDQKTRFQKRRYCWPAPTTLFAAPVPS